MSLAQGETVRLLDRVDVDWLYGESAGGVRKKQEKKKRKKKEEKTCTCRHKYGVIGVRINFVYLFQ